ncbi:MAG TPA: transglycosylase SLT domain-containing protein [Casimicrobiaceae bacterium]|nr:transglycosylase SLT domain-containing protein [Casimicrobiaceae bacterium]
MITSTLHRLARASRALAACLLVVASTAALGQSDADFLAARAAFERRDWSRLDALTPSLAGHPLARYVEFWQIDSRIDTASAQAVHDFLARYPDGPVADRLRVDWLKALGKRGDWTSFAVDYPPPSGEDTELKCYGIQYRWQRDGAAALLAAKPLWFTGKTSPDSCQPLFAALIASGGLTLEDRRQRFRLATAAGNLRLARAIAGDLPGNRRITAAEFATVDRDPLRAVAKGQFSLKTPASRELALYALERAARKDAAAARDGWLKWRNRIDEADRSYGDLRIAYLGARELDPRANQWFKDVRGIGPDSRSQGQQQEQQPGQQPGDPQGAQDWRVWRVRAALRVQAWDDVAGAIDALPVEEQQQSVWRYWRARALAAADRTDEASALYTGLLGDLHYYGLLAAEALGQGASQLAALKRSDTARPDAAALDAFAARPAVQRAVKLAEFDMRLESLREWNWAIRGLDDDGLLVAAEYARRAGLYDRAINTAERTATRFDFALRYLTPYRAEFGAAARDQGMDEELLYGIARQESRFVANIVSGAGAVGLMQLMPGTARWIARQLARDDYTPARISNVDLNTQFGAFYFKYWQDRLESLPALAAAAYNAGPRRAKAWRPASGALEGAIWVETIPFNETRDYVKRVLANTMLYTHALDRPYVRLTERLGIVTAAPDEGSDLASRDP